MNEKKYLVSETDLFNLTYNTLKLTCLEQFKISDFKCYDEYEKKFILESIGISEQENEYNTIDLDFMDIVYLYINNEDMKLFGDPIIFIPFFQEYTGILARVKDVNLLLQAQNKIRDKYGIDFFEEIGGKEVSNCYCFTSHCKKVLNELGYIKYLSKEKNDRYENDRYEIATTPEEIKKIFIFLLNSFGAEIEVISDNYINSDKDNFYSMSSMPGFETIIMEENLLC